MDTSGPIREFGPKGCTKTYAGRGRPHNAGSRYSATAQIRSECRSQVRWQCPSHPARDKCSGRFKHITGKVKNSDVLIDSHGRILRDLRVSLTDRCNFRCLYCLPETEAAHNFYRGRWAAMPNSTPIVQQWVPKSHLLTFEEIERVVRIVA